MGDGHKSSPMRTTHGSEPNLLLEQRGSPSRMGGVDPLSPNVAASTTTGGPLGSPNGTTPRRVSSSSGLVEVTSDTPDIEDVNRGSKFPPEERSLIEELLLRVIECGEIPARVLQFGATAAAAAAAGATGGESGGTLRTEEGDDGTPRTDADEEDANDSNHDDDENDAGDAEFLSSPSSLITAAQSGFVPIDPSNGFPSVGHLESVTAKTKFGFLPTSEIASSQGGLPSGQRGNDVDGLDPFGCKSNDLFLSTPRFLDRLTNLADALFLLPRQSRTTELRKQLRAMEIGSLPSNVVYMPINNVYHRVWRIVADESIAISTKERVPCIVCLEVVDYTAPPVKKRGLLGNVGRMPAERTSQQTTTIAEVAVDGTTTPPASPKVGNAASLGNAAPIKFLRPQQNHHPLTEREVVTAWNSKPRHPHRHETILDKVTNITQQGLRKGLRRLRENNQRSGGGGGGGNGGLSGKDILLWRETSDIELGTDLEAGEKVKGGVGMMKRHSSLRSEGEEELIAFPTTPPQKVRSKLSPVSTKGGKSVAGMALASSSLPPPGGVPPAMPLTPASSAPSSRNSSRPPSPSSAMGQWGSPMAQPPTTTTTTSPSKKKSKRGGKFKKKLSDRKMANEGASAEDKDDAAMEALVGIRDGMEQITSASRESSGGGVVTTEGGGGGGGEAVQYGATHGGLSSDDGPPAFVDDSKKKMSLDEEAGTAAAFVQPPPPPMEITTSTPPGRKKERSTSSSTKKTPRARPPPVVFKESWTTKENRLRSKSAYGSHPGWRLFPILIKSNDDLRQEQLASQLIFRMATILAQGKVPVWLYPYEIIALTDRGGIMEAIPDTISLDSLKRNDPDYVNLRMFFVKHFGNVGSAELADAKACFVESLAAYSMVCFLLQIKDRHNGNILLDNRGHLIHIDFGFYFLSSPGKNSGFESAPFKLTRDFVDLMDGPDSRSFAKFRDLCYRTFLELRKHCYQITLLVEMLMVGNEDLACFRGRPEEAVQGLRERFRLDLNDQACIQYVNGLVDESLENWRTRWYDRYQRFCVGVL